MEELNYELLAKEHGSGRAAARALGIADSTFRGRLKKQKLKAALEGLGVESEDAGSAVMDGLDIKGTSRYYSLPDGGVWVKTDREQEEKKELINSAIEAVNREVKPLPPVKNEPHGAKDLLCYHVLSDFHLGMFAHKEECGEDWDLDKGEQMISAWIDKAISLSPAAEKGVFLQLGDLLHTDGLEALTPASKHALDASARYQKIVDVAINSMRRVISRMLERHDTVDVIMAEGNHDPASSVWLRAMFSRLYEDEPRVTVDMTEHPYYCTEWGNCSIFAHHGHKRPLKQISPTFASLYREVFGRTKYSYGHIGHLHHRESVEDHLMQVEIHNTLPPNDSYAARGGYSSQRRAKTILYHKDHGEAGTINVTPSMLAI